MLKFITQHMRMIDFHQHFIYRSLTSAGIQVHIKPIAIPQKTGDCEKASHFCHYYTYACDVIYHCLIFSHLVLLGKGGKKKKRAVKLL